MLIATVETLASVVSGEILVGDPEATVTGLAVDSRDVTKGGAFVALPGERSDGHDFLGAALANGARLLLVTRGSADLGEIIVAASRARASVIRVTDGLSALQQVASWHRGRLRCAVVGVTGSTGKTTTKDFMISVLSQGMRVAATNGNRNNEIGVPLTILSAGSDTDVLVVEMGMRGRGQIAQLCEIARPDFGLVTNVGTTHIEVLGTQDDIADAKGELVEAVPADGATFLNGDDAYSLRLRAKSAAPVISYGLDASNDVRAQDIALDEASRARFAMVTSQGTIDVSLPIPGRHNVYNALAAAAVGLRLALSLEQVAMGLGDAVFSAMRMETVSTATDVTIINDAYNANPTSMAAAVDTLASMAVTGKRIAVLGDMAELGSLTELAHFKIGEQVARADIQVLVTVGERAMHIANGARAEGMAADLVRACVTADEAVEVLDDVVESGDAVLVKASRCMGLERVVEGMVTPRASR